MRIKIKRIFRYQATATKLKAIQPGVYDVPGDISEDIAQKVLRFGRAEVLAEKKAPENKVIGTPENKSNVAKLPVRSRRSRSKSDK